MVISMILLSEIIGLHQYRRSYVDLITMVSATFGIFVKFRRYQN